MKIVKIGDYELIRPLTPQFQKMVDVASRTSPESRNISHLLEPSQGCANIGCDSRGECYAQDTWKGLVSVPVGDARDLYRRQFEKLGTLDVGLFMSGYCEPTENEEVRNITKSVLGVMISEPNYRPKRGVRFQTHSPIVVADKELLEKLIACHELMPFYVGVSAPNERAVRMFTAAEELQQHGIEVQLCASPAKPEYPAVYAERISALNPATVLYEPQHPTYGKREMPGRKIAVPLLDEFREILRSKSYKGIVADKDHTFTLIKPSDYLLRN